MKLDRPRLTPEEELQEYCRLSFRADGSIGCDLVLLSEGLIPLAGGASKATTLPHESDMVRGVLVFLHLIRQQLHLVNRVE